MEATAERIIEVASRSGYQMEVVRSTPRTPGILPAALQLQAADDASRARLGEFLIVVFSDPAEARGLKVLPPEGEVDWAYHPPDRGKEYWSAGTAYGNIKLTWSNKRKELDERWARLDQLLRSVVGGDQGSRL